MTDEQLRVVAEKAAIQMWRMELGLTPDWDNLLDALHTAGYDEQRCAELWWEHYGSNDPVAVATPEKT